MTTVEQLRDELVATATGVQVMAGRDFENLLAKFQGTPAGKKYYAEMARLIRLAIKRTDNLTESGRTPTDRDYAWLKREQARLVAQMNADVAKMKSGK